jgi:hypothetical protein
MRFFFFSIFPLLWYCAQPPQTTQYTPTAYVRFDAEQQAGQANIHFQSNLPGQTPRPVAIFGGVQCQNSNMQLTNADKPVYAMPLQTYSDTCLFWWRDSSTTTARRFKVPMPRIDSFWFEATPLSLSHPATLRWTGGNLEKGETLVLIWENTAGGSVQTEVFNQSGMPYLELPAAKMKELAVGTWNLYLVRKKMTKIKLPDGEATGIGEYYTKVRRFVVQK